MAEVALPGLYLLKTHLSFTGTAFPVLQLQHTTLLHHHTAGTSIPLIQRADLSEYPYSLRLLNLMKKASLTLPPLPPNSTSKLKPQQISYPRSQIQHIHSSNRKNNLTVLRSYLSHPKLFCEIAVPSQNIDAFATNQVLTHSLRVQK